MIKVYSSLLPKVERLKRMREESYDVCPHCKEEIKEKSTFFDGNDWFHRPCKDKGPIELPPAQEIFG